MELSHTKAEVRAKRAWFSWVERSEPGDLVGTSKKTEVASLDPPSPSYEDFPSSGKSVMIYFGRTNNYEYSIEVS
jgi:hypothetical protein